MDLNAIMHFGKYKGVPIARVKEDDPQYFVWVLRKTKMFNLTEIERLNLIVDVLCDEVFAQGQADRYPDLDMGDMPF